MRLINLLVELIEENCTGCSICVKVCPTLAMEMVPYAKPGGPKQIVAIKEDKCVGCWACEQRCPFDALRMVRHPSPYTVGVSPDAVDRQQIEALCHKARLNPEQVVCFCTTTRAEEVAAAILKGYHTPEELSYHTGIRTGCKVECTQPLLRLIEAAGLPLTPALKHGWQLYGRTITAWEVPEQVKAKYAGRGFYFDDDINLLNRIVGTGEKEDVSYAFAD
jgi:formate hydrogenlyase subunit 6/NADH:ubiquinone oxidoreductase subunit I/bacterioferritin-associated ferredoxin